MVWAVRPGPSSTWCYHAVHGCWNGSHLVSLQRLSNLAFVEISSVGPATSAYPAGVGLRAKASKCPSAACSPRATFGTSPTDVSQPLVGVPGVVGHVGLSVWSSSLRHARASESHSVLQSAVCVGVSSGFPLVFLLKWARAPLGLLPVYHWGSSLAGQVHTFIQR